MRTRPDKAVANHLDIGSMIARDEQQNLIDVSRAKAAKAVDARHTDDALQLLTGFIFHTGSYLDCAQRERLCYANV